MTNIHDTRFSPAALESRDGVVQKHEDERKPEAPDYPIPSSWRDSPVAKAAHEDPRL